MLNTAPSAANPPLLSILIPTHNRQTYAASTVIALAKNLPRSEIVVCDTSDEDLLSDKISALVATGRVLHIRPKSDWPMTVVDNFREATQHATGDYLIFIGDDDFVHSSAEAIADWARHQEVDAVRCTFPASYYWPDFSSRYFGDGYAAKLAIAPFSSSVRPLDTQAAYREALDLLGAGVLRMPRAYLGMVSRTLVQRIEAKHDSLFGGVSPDAYSAALIAGEAAKCVEIDFPFIVPGSSGASTSGQSAQGTHKGRLRDNAHIGPFRDLVWDPRVPEFYSVPTVWSYSLLKAAERRGDDDKANFPRLYAKCLLSHPGHFRETLDAIAVHAVQRGWLVTIASILWETQRELRAQSMRVLRRIRHPSATAGVSTISGVLDCQEASDALSAHVATLPPDQRAWRWKTPRADIHRQA